MREMKNSGVEWIGDIPSDFEMIKIKYIINIEKGKLPQNTNTEGLGEIYVGASEMNGKTPSLYTTDDLLKCKEDDILLLWDGANAGLIANGLCGVVSSTVARCRVNSSRYHPQYIYYTLKNAERYYKDKVTGTTIPHMSSKYIDDTYILNLSFSEQKKIADFLDEKCAEIDIVIEKTKATIEEYKKLKQSVIAQAVTKGIRPNRPMKDSGIEWIGEIPADWQMVKTKYVADVNHGTDPKTEGDIPVYGSGAESFKTCGEYKEGPTVLVGRKGATLHIPHYIEGKYWNVDTAFDVKTYPNYSLRYFFYAACCFDYRYFMSQTTLPGMTQSNYNNMIMPFPLRLEQDEIVYYLDKKCSEIDELIAKKTSLLSELESYKKSLIYEYVTGKKCVE